MSGPGATTLGAAAVRSAEIRALYHRLERAHEGAEWSRKDDVLGLVNDVGALARLVMAAEGQWAPEGDAAAQLRDKLAECLWWILSSANRLDVDIEVAFSDRMTRVERGLTASIGRLGGPFDPLAAGGSG